MYTFANFYYYMHGVSQGKKVNMQKRCEFVYPSSKGKERREVGNLGGG